MTNTYVQGIFELSEKARYFKHENNNYNRVLFEECANEIAEHAASFLKKDKTYYKQIALNMDFKTIMLNQVKKYLSQTLQPAAFRNQLDWLSQAMDSILIRDSKYNHNIFLALSPANWGIDNTLLTSPFSTIVNLLGLARFKTSQKLDKRIAVLKNHLSAAGLRYNSNISAGDLLSPEQLNTYNLIYATILRAEFADLSIEKTYNYLHSRANRFDMMHAYFNHGFLFASVMNAAGHLTARNALIGLMGAADLQFSKSLSEYFDLESNEYHGIMRNHLKGPFTKHDAAALNAKFQSDLGLELSNLMASGTDEVSFEQQSYINGILGSGKIFQDMITEYNLMDYPQSFKSAEYSGLVNIVGAAKNSAEFGENTPRSLFEYAQWGLSQRSDDNSLWTNIVGAGVVAFGGAIVWASVKNIPTSPVAGVAGVVAGVAVMYRGKKLTESQVEDQKGVIDNLQKPVIDQTDDQTSNSIDADDDQVAAEVDDETEEEEVEELAADTTESEGDENGGDDDEDESDDDTAENLAEARELRGVGCVAPSDPSDPEHGIYVVDLVELQREKAIIYWSDRTPVRVPVPEVESGVLDENTAELLAIREKFGLPPGLIIYTPNSVEDDLQGTIDPNALELQKIKEKYGAPAELINYAPDIELLKARSANRRVKLKRLHSEAHWTEVPKEIAGKVKSLIQN